MAIIIRTIHNTTTKPVQIFVPGYNPDNEQVVIPASTTVDLFTMLTGDELEASQPLLNQFVNAGYFTVVATVDTATFNPVGGGGSSGANTSLSNLASTSLNTDIVPVANAVQNLGSNANPFASVYTNAIHGENNLIISSDFNDLIFEADGNMTFNYQNLTQVHDPINAQDAATKNYVDTSAANITLSNLGATAINANLIPGVDATYNLGDGSIPLRWNNVTAVQINTTSIFDSTGSLKVVEIINDDPAWLFQVAPDLNGNRMENLADPVAPQDAATKNYVDTNNTAPSTTYTPAVPSNWTTQPTTVQAALDAIAAKIGPI